jgi:hypothetical protein
MATQNTDANGEDACPECGKSYFGMSTVDARPGGALFEVYKHEEERLGPFTEVTDSCHHVIEWGEDADHD